MKKTRLLAYLLAVIVSGTIALVFAVGWVSLDGWRDLLTYYTDEEAVARYIKTFGPHGPLVFIGLQVLQVVAAPIPGEATGIIGGYLFGTFRGLLYSTIGLTIGSCLAFGLGRWLGHHFLRRIITPETYYKFYFITRSQGKLVTFLLFLIPGFPKDFLCYILGASPLSFRIFFLLSTVGRIPGTWLLSMQGREIRTAHYGTFLALLFLAVAGLALLYMYRDQVFRWMKLRQLQKERRQRGTARDQGLG